MLKKFSEKLYEELNDELEIIEADEKQINKKASIVLSTIRDKLKILKEFVEKHAFNDPTEEIFFFKYIKPRFYSQLIYQMELFSIEKNKPSADKEKIMIFYLKELDFIGRFFKSHSFLYEYYWMDADDLDSLYFIRGGITQSILLPEIPEPNPDFATNCDYLFSKFIALERLKDTLVEKINSIRSHSEDLEQPLTELKWTGDKVNLAEIIYGIYFTGQINHGKTELSTLVKWIGKLFQIDLKRIYSDYKDIRNRKVSSPTRYLDQMRTAMHQRIEDENAFKPQKP